MITSRPGQGFQTTFTARHPRPIGAMIAAAAAAGFLLALMGWSL
jgi:hypothetical protein